MPKGVKLIIAFLGLGVISSIYELLFDERELFILILGIVDALIMYGLLARRRIARMAFIVYASLVIVLGTTFVIVMGYMSFHQTISSFSFLVFSSTLLAIWLSALVYMHSRTARNFFT